MNTKICRTCEKEKKTEHFYYDTQNRDRRSSQCKECHRKGSKERYARIVQGHRHEKRERTIEFVNHESLGTYLKVHIRKAFEFQIFYKLTRKERKVVVGRIDEILKGYEGK